MSKRTDHNHDKCDHNSTRRESSSPIRQYERTEQVPCPTSGCLNTVDKGDTSCWEEALNRGQ